MLSKRQWSIIEYLYHSGNEPVTGKDIAKDLGISLRTVQTELKEINNEILNYGTVASYKGRGYVLSVSEDSYENLCRNNGKKNILDEPYKRSIFILNKLLYAHGGFIKSSVLIDELYISRSTFNEELKKVKSILRQYNLRVISVPHYGMGIEGNEIDFRRCIIKELLDSFILNDISWIDFSTRIEELSMIISRLLHEFHYNLSDSSFQDLLVYLTVAMDRMNKGIFIEEVKDSDIFQTQDFKLASSIFAELLSHYNLALNDNEVLYLALNLQGKRSLDINYVISDSSDINVLAILDTVKRQTGIDLTYDVELRTSLNLHLIPLLSRIENRNQLKNQSLKPVKYAYPLAHEMAIISKSYLEDILNQRIEEGEIVYLTILYGVALMHKDLQYTKKNLLIISSNRRSESLFLTQTIFSWFPNQVNEINVINKHELTPGYLEKYDLILSTVDLPVIYNNLEVIRINFFLTEEDRIRIKDALDGKKSADQYIKYFVKEHYLENITVKDKYEAIEKLCHLISENDWEYEKRLLDSVLKRETMGFTSYENRIALPHPELSMSSSTLIGVANLAKPIEWDNNEVELVILVCYERENTIEIKSLYEAISELLLNENCIDNIIKNKSFENFLHNIKKALELSQLSM